MSWTQVFVLAGIAYGFKVLGLVVIGARPLPEAVERCLTLVPPALVGAIIAADTLTSGHDLVIDERAAGIAVAIFAVWRKAPFVVVVVAAAATTALLRRL